VEFGVLWNCLCATGDTILSCIRSPPAIMAAVLCGKMIELYYYRT
jgi:hypothetical protein